MDYRCTGCGCVFSDIEHPACPECFPFPGTLREPKIPHVSAIPIDPESFPLSREPLDPKGEAGAKKTPLHLLPPVFKAEVADALKLGSEKYGPWNWREAQVEVRTYVGAIMRHVDAFWGGEDADPESGVSHLAHAAASIAIILDAAKCGTLVDNRPTTSAPVSGGPQETAQTPPPRSHPPQERHSSDPGER